MEIKILLKNLEERGYRARYFPTAAEAADCLAAEIRGETVGIGGSLTVREMGLAPRLAAHNEVVWHWDRPEGASPDALLAAAARATVYLSSVNAIAKTGELVNIDGTGNRVSATLFGPRRVYFIVGINKIAEDEAAAIARARNVASPKNAARLGRATPCASLGHCVDCRSPERICRALVVLWAAPRGAEYEVVVVGEELGY